MGATLDTRGGTKGRAIVPNINVTPLVDVVLVLLIIFMVIIPNMQDGKPIELIKVESADQAASEPVVLTVSREQVCTYEEVDMSVEACAARLREDYPEPSGRRILLRGDAGLPYRVMRGLFHEVQKMGHSGVSLAVGVARQWTPEDG